MHLNRKESDDALNFQIESKQTVIKSFGLTFELQKFKIVRISHKPSGFNLLGQMNLFLSFLST